MTIDTDNEFVLVSTTAGIPLLPDMYEAKIVNVKSAPSTKPEYPDQYMFDFEVEDVLEDGGAPLIVHGWVNKKITPGTKLGKWLIKLDEFPAKGTPYDVRHLVGHRLRLVIKEDETGKSVLSDIERSKHELAAYADDGRPIYKGDPDDPAAQAVA